MLAQATFFNPLEPDRQLSKKMQSMKCSNFRESGATALLGLPLPLEYVGANVMADSHSRRCYTAHVSATAQATYRRCSHGPLQFDGSPVGRATNACGILFFYRGI